MTADLKQGSEPLGHHWKSAFEIRIAAPRARTGGVKVDRQELSPFKLVVIFSPAQTYSVPTSRTPTSPTPISSPPISSPPT